MSHDLNSTLSKLGFQKHRCTPSVLGGGVIAQHTGSPKLKSFRYDPTDLSFPLAVFKKRPGRGTKGVLVVTSQETWLKQGGLDPQGRAALTTAGCTFVDHISSAALAA